MTIDRSGVARDAQAPKQTGQRHDQPFGPDPAARTSVNMGGKRDPGLKGTVSSSGTAHPPLINTYGSRAADHVQKIRKHDEWETPPHIFKMACEWAGFTPELDTAATRHNHILPSYLIDALINSWNMDFWCNPPYSRVREFVEYGVQQARIHDVRGIFLTYAKTDTRWWHLWVEGNPDVKTKFIKGRIKFLKDGKEQGPAPYPSVLIRVEAKD